MKNKRLLITKEDFMERFSISRENFQHLVKEREIVPFRWGMQTFLLVSDINLSICNIYMHAQMKAGFDNCPMPIFNNIIE